MLYSRYNYDTRRYDYYEGSGPPGTHAGAPQMAAQRSAIGSTPEDVAWPIPPDAQKVGEGDMPRGRIGTFDTGRGIAKLAILAGIAYLAWRAIR